MLTLRSLSIAALFVLCGCAKDDPIPTRPPQTPVDTTVHTSVVPGPPLVDSRDGRTYGTVRVAGRLWMAENLDFDTAVGALSWCPGGVAGNCSTRGRLYSWRIAMRGDSTLPTQCDVHLDSSKSVCPAGWHLPSVAEWQALFDSLGGSDHAGLVLKSTSGWDPSIAGASGSGLDSVGFDALPAGYRTDGSQGYGYYGHAGDTSAYFEQGSTAAFWTRSNGLEGSCWSAWGVFLRKDYDVAEKVAVPRTSGLSVRCTANP
jgi:uncharacterized protein (TIGR02145 family)